jgi:hypothetical protein
MAEAGRFMTKCEMVAGNGILVGGTGGGAGLDLEGFFGAMVTPSPLREASSTESAAFLMKSRPSSLNGRTYCDTYHPYINTIAPASRRHLLSPCLL